MAHVIDWRLDLMLSHPRLFEVMADEPHLSLGYPLCEAGWRDIPERLCGRIEAALLDGETFEFVRIKQKFGMLRADWDGEVSHETSIRIVEATNLAVARSGCTCETCGTEGRRHVNRGWPATACAEHALGDPALQRHGENVCGPLDLRPHARIRGRHHRAHAHRQQFQGLRPLGTARNHLGQSEFRSALRHRNLREAGHDRYRRPIENLRRDDTPRPSLGFERLRMFPRKAVQGRSDLFVSKTTTAIPPRRPVV
jgi:hypothetical protein